MEFHDTLYACVCQDAFTYRYVLMKQNRGCLCISCYKITATLIYLSKLVSLNVQRYNYIPPKKRRRSEQFLLLKVGRCTKEPRYSDTNHSDRNVSARCTCLTARYITYSEYVLLNTGILFSRLRMIKLSQGRKGKIVTKETVER